MEIIFRFPDIFSGLDVLRVEKLVRNLIENLKKRLGVEDDFEVLSIALGLLPYTVDQLAQIKEGRLRITILETGEIYWSLIPAEVDGIDQLRKM